MNQQPPSVQTVFYLILVIMTAILLIGTLGFKHIAKLSWIDSIHNATMYASGMGPLFEMNTFEGKLFSSVYTMMAGLFFIAVMAVFIAHILDLSGFFEN